ncbi:uncharacterized protein [Spinacia oleracea]|uniref:Retroviral aspartyl protease n=1 Tax=Spinacia oleracea TaxID=3562 RepID=A0ABM3QQZ4_SPIOL|nr:uncharacterized protein LOC130461634 [Spinacia oleracea]
MGSFSIPCAIKNLEISNALCDLAASVSLMRYSVFTKIEVGDLIPTNITLSLADRLVKYPFGKVEDVPLRVGKFMIPVDFVVLDIDEDVHVPIILGRPLLATVGSIIDVKNGKITFKVGMDIHDMYEHLLTINVPLELAILNGEGLADVAI